MKKQIICKILFKVIVLSQLMVTANASSKEMDSNLAPESYCELLEDQGYSSRGFKPETTFGCASEMKPLSAKVGPNGLNNSIAYTVNASRDKLSSISLVLWLNYKPEKQMAYQKLSNLSEVLSLKLTGRVISDLKESVMQGKNKSIETENWKIDVKTSIWPTGLGQDTRVRVYPKNAR